MKKKPLFFVIFLFPVIAGMAQAMPDSLMKKQTIHGVVKNEKNKPVPYASVMVEGEEKGTVVTDSLGIFKIDAKPNAVLIINAEHYESSMEMINGRELITAILTKSPENTTSKPDETVKQQIISNAFQDFKNAASGSLFGGAMLPVFHQSEETRGSRYLFKDWVRGSVLNDKGAVVSDESSFFNYDKIFHYLLVTKDKKSMIQADNQQIQSFTLQGENREYKFVRIPGINTKEFFIELVKSEEKYSLYRSIKTNFEKANYQSSGLVESGKDYDEYVDENKYYLVFPGGKYKTIELKKKSIREVFSSEEKKVNAYFSHHKEDSVDESYLTGLIQALNQ
jgi:hypothetical protein